MNIVKGSILLQPITTIHCVPDSFEWNNSIFDPLLDIISDAKQRRLVYNDGSNTIQLVKAPSNPAFRGNRRNGSSWC